MILAACGGSQLTDATQNSHVGNAPTTDDQPTGGETPLANDAGGTAGMGPGKTVAELLDVTGEGPFLVTGYVFVGTDGTVVISDAIAESYPPQPAGAQAQVEGADLIGLPLVEGPVDAEIPTSSWTEQPVQVLGNLVDGVLVGISAGSA